MEKINKTSVPTQTGQWRRVRSRKLLCCRRTWAGNFSAFCCPREKLRFVSVSVLKCEFKCVQSCGVQLWGECYACNERDRGFSSSYCVLNCAVRLFFDDRVIFAYLCNSKLRSRFRKLSKMVTSLISANGLL